MKTCFENAGLTGSSLSTDDVMSDDQEIQMDEESSGGKLCTSLGELWTLS